MPNKTIYVSEDDVELYDRAQELAGGNLSAAIARALRRFVEKQEDRQSGFREVAVRVSTGQARRTQRFSGVLLGEWRHPSGKHRIEVFRVYRTPKGHFVLHVQHMPDWAVWSDPQTWRDWVEGVSSGNDWREWASKWTENSSGWGPSESSLEVTDSLEEFRDKVPTDLFDNLERASEHPIVEDLDI